MVWYLFKELELEWILCILMDYELSMFCPFYCIDFDDKKMKHHILVIGEHFNGDEAQYYESGQYICTCMNWNLQLSFDKQNYKLIIYFHNESRYDIISESIKWEWWLWYSWIQGMDDRVGLFNSRTCTWWPLKSIVIKYLENCSITN